MKSVPDDPASAVSFMAGEGSTSPAMKNRAQLPPEGRLRAVRPVEVRPPELGAARPALAPPVE